MLCVIQGLVTCPSLQVSDWLLHIIPHEDLRRSHYDFASEYVAQQVFKKLVANSERQLEVFLASSQGQSELGPVRGRLMELIVFQQLEEGISMDCRDLDTGGSAMTMHHCARVQKKRQYTVPAIASSTFGWCGCI